MGMVRSREPFKFDGHQPHLWTADRLRRCQHSSPVSVILLMVVGQLLITPTVEICIQQLGRVEEII